MLMTPSCVDNTSFVQARKIYVDHTHLGRHVTGLERITQELFAPDSLAPLQLTPVSSKGTANLIWMQNAVLPARLAGDPKALVLCPGFPPARILSLFGARVIPYIHDLFLLTRRDDLNLRARLYMAPAFRQAVTCLPFFLVNSEYTRDELRKYCSPNARIELYRPGVRNLFGLDADNRLYERAASPLRLIALGTVEPRKNLSAAARLLSALRAQGQENAQLDIVGRIGWGDDIEELKNTPGVTLHGYQPMEKIREMMARADLFLNTSHDEGLGLPLLEAQYAGMPVVAPDKRVFREVLAGSGLLIDPARPQQAAMRILQRLKTKGWRQDAARLASANLERWNANAQNDHARLTRHLMTLAG